MMLALSSAGAPVSKYQWKKKMGAKSPPALFFPFSQPLHAFSQVCSQGATIGGLCGGESDASYM